MKDIIYIPWLLFLFLYKHVLMIIKMMMSRTTAVPKIPFPISDPIRTENGSTKEIGNGMKNFTTSNNNS